MTRLKRILSITSLALSVITFHGSTFLINMAYAGTINEVISLIENDEKKQKLASHLFNSLALEPPRTKV